jgi:hypothetical protein
MMANLEGGSFTRDLYVEEGSGDGHFPPEGSFGKTRGIHLMGN